MINYDFSPVGRKKVPIVGAGQLFRIMKLTSLLLVVFCMHLSASTHSQTVSIDASNQPLSHVLRTIKKQTDLAVVYNDRFVNPDQKVSIHVESASLTSALESLLKPLSLTYHITEKTIVIAALRNKATNESFDSEHLSETQQRVITGKVTDEDGNPLEGVTVAVKGTTIAAATDAEGKFEISVSGSGGELTYTLMGFESTESAIDDRTSITVSLKTMISDLDEVVVVGYGVQKKRDLTGAISSIKMDEIQTNSVSTISHALAGKAAGLRAVQNSAQVGGAVSFRIRGEASTGAGNDPLIIIDGFPVSSSPSLGSGNRYDSGSTDNILESINPNDIESVEILKDASSTAIYGSRAGHGVIIITTKRGRQQKVAVTYSGNISLQKMSKEYEMLDARGFMNQRNAYAYELWLKENAKDVYKDYITLGPDHQERDFSPYYTDEEIRNQTGITDWIGAVTQLGKQQQHNISLLGGTDGTQYMVSANHLRQQGIVRRNEMNRLTGRVNLDQKISKVFSTGLSLNISQNNYDNVALGTGRNENAGIISAAADFNPLLPIYDESGNYMLIPTAPFVPNPVSLLEIEDHTLKDRILASAYLQAEPVKGLLFKLNLGADRQNQKRKNYLPTTTLVGANVNGMASIGQSESTDYLTDITANYSKEFERHNLTALLGYSFQQFNNEGFSAGNQDFLTDAFSYYNLGAGQFIKPSVGSWGEKRALGSYFGRINYNLDDKYLSTITLRSDGASNFNENHRWGWFPSLSLGWRFSEESFLKSISEVLSDGKLRVSYGITGNSNIGNRTLSFFRASSSYTVFGDEGHSQVYNAQLGNPQLTWEKTKELNVGLDLGFFKNRISISAEYFDRTISDLLVSNKALLSYNEIRTIAANIGSTQSSGFELTINTRNVTTPVLKWSTDLTLSRYNDRWKERDPEWKPAFYQSDKDPIRAVFTYQSDGLLQAGEKAPAHQRSLLPGQIKLKDLNNDGKLDDQDITMIGVSDPKLIFGFNNTLNYKDFDLNVYFNGEINRLMGASYYENLAHGQQSSQINGGRNVSKGFMERWTHSNQSGRIPSSIISDFSNGDYFYKKISFVRLRSITLGYNLPMSSSKIARSLRVYINVNNPLVITNWTGLDPETDNNSNYAYPNISSFSLGIDVKF